MLTYKECNDKSKLVQALKTFIGAENYTDNSQPALDEIPDAPYDTALVASDEVDSFRAG